MLLLTEKRGIMLYNNGEWKSRNRGLPENFIPVKIHADTEGNFYLITLKSGLYTRKSSQKEWRSLNSPEFLTGKKTGKPGEYRKISAFAINRSHPANIALATKHALYISKNRGHTWKKVSLRGLHRRNYITALSLAGKENRIYAGTSFKGIFVRRGKRFYKLSAGISPVRYSTKVNFYEEITSLAASPDGKIIAAGMAFGGGLFLKKGPGRWIDIKIPLVHKSISFVHQVKIDGENITASTDEGIFTFNQKDKSWKKRETGSYRESVPDNIKALGLLVYGREGMSNVPVFIRTGSYARPGSRLLSASKNRRGLYSSAHQISRKPGRLIRTIKKSGLNSIVIDMKDDFGYLYYPTRLKAPRQAGAARKPVRIKKILAQLKKNGIYAIARVVVFKDRVLFRAFGNRYAIINRRTGRPWRGTEGEYWVDPHSDFVQKYNADIAVELQELGFDEIQFDYIRFPTDGPTSLCKFRYREKKDIFKSEVISDFLTRAKSRLKVPVSVDIYGFNAWYHCGNWMGQDIEELARIVDVICPMDYPSHFGNRFMMAGERAGRPYRILKGAGIRAHRLARSHSYIRPYLQAFNLLSPTWGPGYILNQVQGALESNCSGYIFWNARTDYRMVERALSRENIGRR
jgi:hypothetical protein